MNIMQTGFLVFGAMLIAAALPLVSAVGQAAETKREGQPTAVPTAGPPVQLAQYALPDTVLGRTAWTFVAPANWNKAGGVYWTGRLVPLAYYSELTIANPQGSEQLRLFPTIIFVATDNPLFAGGIPMCPYLQPDECITRILIPRFRPAARSVRVLGSDRQPAQLMAEARARAQTQGAPHADIRAARVLLEYEESGRPMREIFFCTLMALPRSGGPTTWCIERALGLRAEQAGFERSYRLLGLLASSLRENQDWVQARGRQLRAMIPPPTPPSSGGLSILDVSRSISRNNDQFLKNIDAINTQRLNSPASDGWTRAFRNTERVRNPATGEEMDVTGGYLQYYQAYSGQIYSSDNPTDFYLQTKIGGTVLEKVQ